MDERGQLVAKCIKRENEIQSVLDRLDNMYDPSEEFMNKTLTTIAAFEAGIQTIYSTPQEIEWNILTAQAFITSVQTTTGIS